MWNTLVSVVLIVCLISGTGSFLVPTPKIQVFESGGVTMSIPHTQGIKSVLFDVNVNKDLDNGPGEYSKYILHPVNGFWIYDINALCLKRGDVLYYMMFIYFDKMGLRQIGEPFIVYEFSSKDELTSTQRPITPPPAVASTTPDTLFEESNNCNAFVQNVTQSIFHLENQMNVLREENNILKELASGDNLRLNLTGLITLTGEPLEIVKFVLDEKLDVEGRVVKNAWRNGNATVTFEVDSLTDKVEIIRRAKDKLMQSTQIKITYK